MPSIKSNKPKETAGAHEAPKVIMTMDSEMPRINPATKVPLMLPNPASTTTQKVRPM
jgi:hypothetical protein